MLDFTNLEVASKNEWGFWLWQTNLYKAIISTTETKQER